MSGETPASLGYRMPAEWEPQASTWLAWPHDPLTWVQGIDVAEEAYLAMLHALTPSQPVDLLVTDARMRDRVADRLQEEGIVNVRLHPADHADSWLRDTGPTFLTHRTSDALAAVNWRFNAWGGKYDTLLRDDRLGGVIAELAGARRFDVRAVMEGGSFEVNGAGTVLTTEQCLLNPNRNPSLDREALERLLCDHLGAEKVLWLGEGIAGDDTDGHVDDIARFVDPRTVVACVEPDASDPNHAPLAENLARLARMTDQDGRPLRVVELPMPSPVGDDEGRVPASYANFLVANEVVLLPTYDDPNDARARAILEKVFPGRRVVGVPSRPLIFGMGACHCLSQQQPVSR